MVKDKVFSLRSIMRQGGSGGLFSPLVFNMVVNIQAGTIRQERKKTSKLERKG